MGAGQCVTSRDVDGMGVAMVGKLGGMRRKKERAVRVKWWEETEREEEAGWSARR